MLDKQPTNGQNARDIVSLKEYFTDIIYEYKQRVNERFDLQDKAVQAALLSAERAVTKAEQATERRFESVNEFRAALSDQSKDLMTRNEYGTAHQSLIDKIDAVTIRIAAIEGQEKGNNQTWGYVIAIVGILIGAVTAIIFAVRK